MFISSAWKHIKLQIYLGISKGEASLTSEAWMSSVIACYFMGFCKVLRWCNCKPDALENLVERSVKSATMLKRSALNSFAFIYLFWRFAFRLASLRPEPANLAAAAANAAFGGSSAAVQYRRYCNLPTNPHPKIKYWTRTSATHCILAQLPRRGNPPHCIALQKWHWEPLILVSGGSRKEGAWPPCTAKDSRDKWCTRKANDIFWFRRTI